MVCTAYCLFHTGSFSTLETPSALRATSPKRGSALRGGRDALTDSGSEARGEGLVYALGAPFRGAVER